MTATSYSSVSGKYSTLAVYPLLKVVLEFILFSRLFIAFPLRCLLTQRAYMTAALRFVKPNSGIFLKKLKSATQPERIKRTG
jgi:hypothetical protein